MQDVKAQLVSKLKEANSVLVCVSNNPSVDQLSATLALTLILNKLGKHATAVFSGEVPSALSFLKPESTIKKDTNSLQDFIISLDKEKADKLRYKVEDQFVKIFITPYNTAISEKDLEFSQGEVNVDVVVALGVHDQQDLDKAIAANGRILHDATVISVTTTPTSTLGSINLSNEKSSSLCEMLVELTPTLAPSNLIDSQIANALLSGIVAETDRFSNEKTSASTMSISSSLLQLGANQQLVASKISPEHVVEEKTPENVTSEIEDKKAEVPLVEDKDKVTVSKQEENSADLKVEHTEDKADDSNLAQVHIDEHGNITAKPIDKTVDSVPPKVDTTEDEEEEKEDPLRRPERVVNPLGGTTTPVNIQTESPDVSKPTEVLPVDQVPTVTSPVSIIHTEIKDNEQVSVEESNRPTPPPVPPPILPPKTF